MERGALRDLFAWTGEKLLLWAHLSAFIGLVRRSERSPELLIVPQPSLILDALRWAAHPSSKPDEVKGVFCGEGQALSAPLPEGTRGVFCGEGQALSAPLPEGGPPQLGGEGLSLAAALTQIDAEIFACFTARGRVHRGLAQTLLAMERLGHIRMTHHADAARSLLLGDRRVSEVALTTPRIATDNSL
ncbi:MAG: hypothetical protein WCI67_06545 [Chloroflexales bacterium]